MSWRSGGDNVGTNEVRVFRPMWRSRRRRFSSPPTWIVSHDQRGIASAQPTANATSTAVSVERGMTRCPTWKKWLYWCELCDTVTF